MKDTAAQRLVFIDESYSNCGMTPSYGRGEKGKRVEDDKPYRGEKVTMIGALGHEDLLTLMTIDCSTTSDVFEAFVKEFLLPVLKPGDIVVLDNLSSHKDDTISNLIESVGARVKFLPPYSPDLNPIEECWSKLKHLIRKFRPRTREALDNAVAWAVDKVTKSDIRGWYNDAGYVL